jgi:hypothetical protein
MPLATLFLLYCALRPELIEVRGNPLEAATYKGHEAVHFSDAGGDQLGLIKDSNFRDGTIELDIAAMPAKGAVEAARGFAGLAFRVKDRRSYEAFYLRPTNGRADDSFAATTQPSTSPNPTGPGRNCAGESPASRNRMWI